MSIKKKLMWQMSPLLLLSIFFFQNCEFNPGFQANSNLSSFDGAPPQNELPPVEDSDGTANLYIRSMYIDGNQAHFHTKTSGDFNQATAYFKARKATEWTEQILDPTEESFSIQLTEAGKEYAFRFSLAKNGTELFSSDEFYLRYAIDPNPTNPEILATLNNLGGDEFAELPRFNVLPYPLEGETEEERIQRGKEWKNSYPFSVNYSNTWIFVPKRNEAFYHAGNHGHGRRADVWGYHLLSNTMTQHALDVGGDHYDIKWAMAQAQKDGTDLTDYPNNVDPELIPELDKLRAWWDKYVIYENQNFSVLNGGPISPSHNWDTFIYDPRDDKLLFPYYRGHGSSKIHRWVAGDNPGTADGEYPIKQCMYAYDLPTMSWECIQHEGMGVTKFGSTTMYIPEKKELIAYMAAGRDYRLERWHHDTDVWEAFQPNGGTVNELVKAGDAPIGWDKGSELACEYGPKAGYALCLIKNRIYKFDPFTYTWSFLGEDARLQPPAAHHAVFYDSNNNVFVVFMAGNRPKFEDEATCTFQTDSEGKVVYGSQRYPYTMIYDVATSQWIESQAECPEKFVLHGNPTLHYDSNNNVFVIRGGGLRTILYRWK